MPPKKAAKRKRTSRRRRKRSAGRLRILRGVLAVILVVTAGISLYLYVAVGARFEGRLWALPAEIYSDRKLLITGEALPASHVEQRLARNGYARVEGAPTRPGEFRRSGQTIDVYRRAFDGADGTVPAARLHLRFSAGRLARLRDGRGNPLTRAELEPELLATIYGARQEERRVVTLDEVPPVFIQAVLSAEDGRYFSHHGFDLRGILRAAFRNARAGRIVQGGSTITQQTVKNLYLGQQRTWWRKLREVAMALILDARYTKERILEVYLNEVYLGQRGPVAICGVQAAARFYFGRDLQHLSLGEWALLAGLIRSPGGYNPFVDPERAAERRAQVLEAMVRRGAVTAEEVEPARTERLRLASGRMGFAHAPYAVDHVRAELASRYPRRVLLEEGLRIQTTLDTFLQGEAEQALQQGLARLDESTRGPAESLQGAVIVTQPSSGAILAMVGGRDYAASQFNRASQARRQPGSCFKPFVYATGFEQTLDGDRDGLTPATLLEDSPLEIVSGGKLWKPLNYDREFRGLVTARRALEDSLNVPTVRAAEQVGLERVVETARRCGIRSRLSAVPSLALGTGEITPLELAEAYGTIAHRGRHAATWIIRTVHDREGELLEGRRPEVAQAIRPQTAFLISDLLRGAMEHGTARSARALGFRGEAAGKTGTTDDTRDAWFVGFTSKLLALVWVGHDDNTTTGLTGASGALPIWVDLMRRAAGESRRAATVPPRGIVRVLLDPESGKRAVPGCPDVIEEFFVAGTAPRAECHLHQGRFKRWLRRMRDRSRPGV